MRLTILASAVAAGFLLGGCSGNSPANRNSATEKKPIPLTRVDQFPEEYQGAARDVAAFLATKDETADQFYVELGRDGNLILFHLWHVSAFLPENRNMLGNPGGKCRDVWYDPEKHAVVKMLWWQ